MPEQSILQTLGLPACDFMRAKFTALEGSGFVANARSDESITGKQEPSFDLKGSEKLTILQHGIKQNSIFSSRINVPGLPVTALSS